MRIFRHFFSVQANSASAFSPHPKFQETLNFLDDVYIRVRRMPSAQTSPEEPVKWLPSSIMSERVGFQLAADEHRLICEKASRLIPYLREGGDALLDLVRCFAAVDNMIVDDTGRVMSAGSPTPMIDRNGWARATGRRKTSTANVILKPIDKADRLESIVNDKPLPRAFQLIRHLHHIAYPLKHTDRCGRYIVEAQCRGGGPSGKAGALRLAIAKALVKMEPHLQPSLDAEGLLSRDSRSVERKKPGQEKARRKFAWVKR